MRLFTYAVKELKNNRRFGLLFILNLALGLSGLLALDGFKVALDRKVKTESRAMLGADFSLSARRPFSNIERERMQTLLPMEADRRELIEVFSMVAGPERRSRLVQIKAIEEGFPFYGHIDLMNYGTADNSAYEKLHRQSGVWIYPELSDQLDIKTGDPLYIGEKEFQVLGVVKADAASGVTSAMAPRVYMSLGRLYETELMGQGSLAWHSLLYHLPSLTDKELKLLQKKAFELLDSPEIRVHTHETAGANSTLLVSRLNDFLGLTSLVGLFLAAVGSGFLFRSYFRRQTTQVAILLSLGASLRRAFTYYLGQLMLLGFFSALLASVIAWLLVPLLTRVTRGFLPFELDYSLSLPTLLVAFLLAIVGSVVIALPILVGLKKVRPSLLLAEDPRMSSPPGLMISLVAALPGILFFWALTVGFSRSYQVGTLFTALFLIASLALALMAQLFIRLLPKVYKPKSLHQRWALRDLSRHRLVTTVCFVCIGLGALLLNIIPQIQKSLSTELEQPEKSKVPSLFLFDIQEEQVEPLSEVLRKNNLEIDQLSPTIQARLTSVNGEPFDKGQGVASGFSREEENEMRFRNRGFNLTYRAELSDSETLVEGRPFSGTFKEGQGLAEISLEKRFATRLGLKIDDHLVFDVEGVPVEGQVVSLRQVRWTSFQPNFFVQFQPGVLEMAPKAFIATLPPVSLDQKSRLQDTLVESLPNISMIDIGRVVEQLSGLIEQMSWAILLMSFLCLFAGFIVIYSIANHQATQRRWDIGLLKSLGMSHTHIRLTFVWQFIWVAFMATSFGALLSLLFSFLLSYYLFDGLWVFAWVTPVLSVLGALLLTWLVSEVALRQSLRQQTADLFRSQ